MHVGGEGEGTEGDISALPREGEENRTKSLSHTCEEGRTGGMEDDLLLQHGQGKQCEAVVRVQGSEQRPVGEHTVCVRVC